jgi:hypothetical protein
MVNVGKPQRTDGVFPGQGKIRLAFQVQDHTLPYFQVGKSCLQQWDKSLGRLYKTRDPSLQVRGRQVVRLTGQDVVPGAVCQHHAGVRPAVGETRTIACVDDVQPYLRARLVCREPTPQLCQLRGGKLNHRSTPFPIFDCPLTGSACETPVGHHRANPGWIGSVSDLVVWLLGQQWCEDKFPLWQ